MKALGAVFRTQTRYWQRHRMQGGLALVGIAVGVTVFTAVRLSNAGAVAAFSEGVEAFAGKATHRVYSPSGSGIPEGTLRSIMDLPGVLAASPSLTGRVRAEGGTQPWLTVLGIDPINDIEFRDFSFVAGERSSGGADSRAGLERFLRVPGAVVLPGALAQELGVTMGDQLPVTVRGRSIQLPVVGVFDPPPRNRDAFGHTIVVDISSFQELIGKPGQLDEIRLLLNDAGAAAVRRVLPPALALEPIGARAERVDRMSQAFRVNLESLGLFALLVAAFLIYNTAMFSVVQREHGISVLRCLGASTRSVFGALILEAAVLGLLGGSVGVLAGRGLADILVRGTSATLFEVILSQDSPLAHTGLDWSTWGIGLLLGAVCAVVGAVVPAVEATRVSPLAAVRGIRGRARTRTRLGLWTTLAFSLLCVAAGFLFAPSDSLILGLIGATALAVGGAFLSPLALWLASWVLGPPLHRLLGIPGLLAGRSLSRSISRTGMATASLMVALALALAIQISVHSFRHTFELWLEQAITADLYIGPATGTGSDFPQTLASRLRDASWARDVAELKSRRVVTAGREVLVIAIHPDVFERTASLPMLDAAPGEAMRKLRDGAAFISETLAFPLHLRAGASIPLPGARGVEAVSIAAVVQNYSVPGGLVYLDIARFTALFGAVPTQQVAVWLRPGANIAEAIQDIEKLPEAEKIHVNPNGALKHEALRIFDRTFAITQLLGALAAFVAFFAVVSALLALLEERIRLLGHLRAIGVSRRQVGLSLALEAALLAFVAGLLSWAVGVLMSAALVFVINRRAFGWTLQFLPGQGSYIALLVLAVVAAVLGSAYPIWRATRQSVIATIREE